jgi:molybdate transport system ATP-binding protein
VVAVVAQVNSAALRARVHLERRDAVSSKFTLSLSVEVAPGITILIGPSGAGKSTLLDCIAGLLAPDDGRIAIGDEVLFDSALGVNLSPQRRHVAYLFQSLALFPHLNVEENVAYGIAKLSAGERRRKVVEILEAFRVANLRKRKPREISGGEKQRVALARSLVTSPHALLLDEPLTGLEAALKYSLVDDLRAWNSLQRIPILYVTHNRDEVDALGERVIAIEHGRAVSSGIPREVLDAPRRRRLAQAAGFENFLSGAVMELREADGVMRVRLSNSASEIEVPLGFASPGDTVRIAVRAGDILLATERPTKLSARNVLEGTLASVEQRGATVVCRVDAGVRFIVHVTPGAQRALELSAGKRVWLVLKTHSCHFVED